MTEKIVEKLYEVEDLIKENFPIEEVNNFLNPSPAEALRMAQYGASKEALEGIIALMRAVSLEDWTHLKAAQNSFEMAEHRVENAIRGY